MNFKHMLLIITLLVLALAACQPETANLPTLAVIPTQTATEIGAEATAREAEDELSTETTEPETLPTRTPLFETPSADDSATQSAQLVPDFTPPPTTDISTLGGVEVDFSAVSLGDTISLLGTLTIDNATQPALVIVTDSEGNKVSIDISAEMAELMIDTSVYVVGVVTSTEGGIALQLVTLQEMSEATAEAPITMPSFELTPDSTPQSALPGVVETMQLAANLTVLDAYDQLIGQLSGQLDNRVWVSASGNPSAGWSFSFYDESDESILIYLVLADGTVLSQPGLPRLDAVEIFTLDRELITVDSEELLAAYDESGGTEDIETIVLLLQAVDAEIVSWSILDVDGQSVFAMNAATGDVIR